MYTDNTKLIDSIREHSREFRRLEEKHKEYEEILERLLKHNYLSTKQEVLKKTIKKQKLMAKDRMAEIVKEFVADCPDREKRPI